MDGVPQTQIANKWDPISIEKTVLGFSKPLILTFLIGGLLAVGDWLNTIHVDGNQALVGLVLLLLHNLITGALNGLEQYKAGVPQSVISSQ